jgi:DNA-binding FadR family transcriptional regulator
MAQQGESRAGKGQRRNLVPSTAERLRELIFAQEPDRLIGSLPELATLLGVGIVTVQQAARILEHEGLLEVRRGPGGGYYGMRPDAAVLERSLAAYMRTQPASWEEALDMTSLLFNELCAAAAQCTDRERQEDLRAFARRVGKCDSDETMVALEQDFQDLLFRMVNRPLFELLTRVTLRFAASRPDSIYRGLVGVEQWQAGRRRIIDAILRQDEALARFEADRSNRQVLLAALRRMGEPTSS